MTFGAVEYLTCMGAAPTSIPICYDAKLRISAKIYQFAINVYHHFLCFDFPDVVAYCRSIQVDSAEICHRAYGNRQRMLPYTVQEPLNSGNSLVYGHPLEQRAPSYLRLHAHTFFFTGAIKTKLPDAALCFQDTRLFRRRI